MDASVSETKGGGVKCAVCGKSLSETDPGQVFGGSGEVVYVCQKCEKRWEARQNKKWWQFWL